MRSALRVTAFGWATWATFAAALPGRARAQQQQPPPPSWAQSSAASFSGTDLLPPASSRSAAAPTPAPALAAPGSDERTKLLEARVDEIDARTRGADSSAMQLLRHLTFSGYVQPQFVAELFNTAASPNTAALGGTLPPGIGAGTTIPLPNGATTNRTAFRMRRARLMVRYTPTDYARVTLEIEPFVPVDVPQGAPFPGLLRTTEATGIARIAPGVRAEITAGIFRVPFGYELQQSSADRRFAERSWGAQNMFPGSYDTGAKARLFAFDERMTIGMAVVNGNTLGERTWALVPDLNRAKDMALRGAWDFGPVMLGTSGYVGAGQIVDAQALRLKNYTRWAWNAEASVKHPLLGSKVGDTKLFVELTLGENMDRGVLYAAAAPQIGPGGITGELARRRQLSLWGRIEQDLGEWVTLGVRVDRYAPDTTTGGGRTTVGGSGALNFTKGLYLLTEVSKAWDDVALVGPGTREITVASSILQGRF